METHDTHKAVVEAMSTIRDNIFKILIDTKSTLRGVTITKGFGPIDTGKFNRIEFSIDDIPMAISLFRPGPVKEVIVEETAEQPELQFKTDHRESNPKLHQLYVGWARETIRATSELCQTLWEHSRYQSSDIATAAWEKLKEHIRTDTAFFEAAALEFMRDRESIEDPKIYAGETLRNIPPGEYEGYIQERDGKLYFELSDAAQAKGD